MRSVAPRAWSGGLLLAALLLLGGGLRLVALEAAEPLRLVGDENYYVQVANHIAQGRGHLYVGGLEGPARAWRPPAHAWILSRLVDAVAAPDPSGDPALLRRLAALQVALGSLLVLLTALLGVALFDARTGLMAGALAAVYPALVAHSHYLWSETLFAVLMTSALLGVVVPPASTRLGACSLDGACLRSGRTHARDRLAGGWRLRGLVGVDGAGGAAPGGSLCAGPSCWASHCSSCSPGPRATTKLFGRLVPVSTVGWFAAAEGNSLESPQWLLRTGSRAARLPSRLLLAARRDPNGSTSRAATRSNGSGRAAHLAREEDDSQPGVAAQPGLRAAHEDPARRLWRPAPRRREGAAGREHPLLPGARHGGRAGNRGGMRPRSPLASLSRPRGGRPAPRGDERDPALPRALAPAARGVREPRCPRLAGAAPTAGQGPRRVALAALLFFFGICVPYFYRFGGRP